MSAMHLSSLIDKGLVFLKSPLQDVKEIYTFMVSQICRKHSLKNYQDEFIERLMNRSFDEGTLFPTGAAIPHLHLEDFNDTIISVLVPEKQIETEHGTIKVFFMVFTGKKDNTLYLHILQSTIKLSKDTELFKTIIHSKTPNEFLNTIKTGDFIVKRAITVSDIMSTRIITVKANTTLKELGQLFYEHNNGYFLVIDDDEKPIGEATVLDYLMVGFPEYTNFLSNLYFMKSFEPFEKLIKEEHSIPVKSIMKPLEVTVQHDTPIFKAIFLMNKHKRRDLPVLDKGKLVGIISFIDIFRKVVKG